MYLYLYCSENKEGQNRGGPGRNRSEFSERLVRKALRDYCDRNRLEISDETIQSMPIIKGEKGKPYINGLPEACGIPAIHYSVSHSGNWWGCLIAGESVGFDLEILRDNVNYEKIARRYFTEEEYQWILSAGPEAFFDVWVRKEAYVKYRGTGLAEGLDRFTVIAEGVPAQQVLSAERGVREPLPCYITPCRIGKGIKAAYCCGSRNKAREMIFLEKGSSHEQK